MTTSKSHHTASHSRDNKEDLLEKGKHLGHEAADQLKEVADHFKSGVSGAYDYAHDKLDEATGIVKTQSAEALDSLYKIVESKPLTSLGIAVLVGAAIAFIIKK